MRFGRCRGYGRQSTSLRNPRTSVRSASMRICTVLRGRGARFPYHERSPYKPEPAATPEHLLACMQEAGVDFAVVVHPEPYGDDHRYLEHCLNVSAKR